MLTVADTAFAIATIRAEESGQPAPLFEDPYAAFFAAAGAHAAEGTKRFLDLPFFREGIRLRTRFIDDAVRDAVASGIRQVVILGAGFDARALRMPELAAARVFEIDTPGQLERKRAILAASGVEVPPRVTYVPVDFETTSLESVVLPREPTAFVWEGVIGYIDRRTIDASLRFMASAGPTTRVIFTYADAFFEPEGPDAALRELGFSKLEGHDLGEIWRKHLPGDPPDVASVSKVGVAIV